MLAIVDGTSQIEATNDVKVVIGCGSERHITVTHEGIIVDLVENGEITATFSITHEELLVGKDED